MNKEDIPEHEQPGGKNEDIADTALEEQESPIIVLDNFEFYIGKDRETI